MALSFQLATTPLPTDLPYTNYGTTEIPSNLAVITDPQNLLGVSGDGIGITLPSTGSQAAPYAFGVTMERIPAGSNGRVRTQGLVACKADGAITAGTRVCASTAANKNGWVRPATAGEPQLGLAQTLATDGDDVLVLLQPASST